jgi:hypothetical protein
MTTRKLQVLAKTDMVVNAGIARGIRALSHARIFELRQKLRCVHG